MASKNKLLRPTVLRHAVSYTPSPRQQEFHEACEKHRFVLLTGGIRFGKSFAAAHQVLRFIYRMKLRPPRGYIVVPVYREGKGALDRFREVASGLIMRELRGERAFLMVPPSGYNAPWFRVEVRSADDPNHLRGEDLAFVWLDEARDMCREAYHIAMGRLLDTSGRMIISTTPLGRRHWLWTDFIGKVGVDPNYAWIGGPGTSTYDRPGITEAEVRSLEEQYGPELARQEIYGEFVDTGKLVLPQFDASRHVVKWDGALDGGRLYAGIDFGYKHWFVCLWVLYRRDYVHVLREYSSQYRVADAHYEAIQAEPLSRHVQAWYCDPNTLAPRMELQKSGLPLQPAPRSGKPKEELCTGVRLMARLLSESAADGRPRLRIDPSCRLLIRQMQTWENHTSKDEPLPRNNDAPDALRYCLRAREVADVEPAPTKRRWNRWEAHLHTPDPEADWEDRMERIFWGC